MSAGDTDWGGEVERRDNEPEQRRATEDRRPGPNQPPLPGESWSFSEVELHQGPMPPSAELERLEKLHPGITGEWFTLVKQGTTAEIERRDRDSKAAERVSDGEVDRASTGQSIAMLLTLICIGASITFFAVGNNWAGGLLLSFPVLQLIQSFIPRK